MNGPQTDVRPRPARAGVRSALVLVALLLLCPAAAAQTPHQPQAETFAAEDLVRRTAAGEAVNLFNVTVEGDVDLRSVGTVTAPLRCRLTGSFTGTDVVFERTLEISQSTVVHPVALSGAIFRERASFDGTTFLGPADLSSARFAGDASFVDSKLAGNDFTGAAFEQDAEFFLTAFGGRAGFGAAEFGGRGNFRLLVLRAGGAFSGVRARGDLAFDGSLVGSELNLTNLAGSASLSLEGLVYLPGAEVVMNNVLIGDLRMDPGDVRWVRGPGPPVEALDRIEDSAARRDDLALANDARYERLSLLGRGKTDPLARALDTVFYRGAAGYLVRPSHPLLLLVGLMTVATFLRAWMAVGR